MADVVTVTPALLRELAPQRPDGDAHKGMRGCVLVVGGSRETPGAALLAGIASLRAGAGVLKVATAASVAPGLALAIPEARVAGLGESAGGDMDTSGTSGADLEEMVAMAQSVLVGPGFLTHESVVGLLPRILDSLDDAALVIDAHALRAVSPELLAPHRSRTVLIPNTKEAAELAGADIGDVEADARPALDTLVGRFGCAVAIRGGETFVGAPGQPVYHDVSGVPGLGTSGSGDVLAGYLTGLLARGTPPLAATLWAVRVHAEAGRRLSERVAALGFLARELLDELGPAALALGA